MDYPIVVNRLSDEDGGGYLAYFPDLIGCMSDGESPTEAVANALLAFDEWMDAAKTRGIDIPAPFSVAERETREREEILSAIRSIRSHHDEIDDRLLELERRIVEIEEEVAHAESWRRFGVLSGVPVTHVSVRRTLLIGD